MSFLRNRFTTSHREYELLLPPLKRITTEIEEENEFVCLLEEYKALREEILFRLGAQNQLVNFTVALIGAALAVGVSLADRGHYILLLVFPLLFVTMGWLVLIQETYIDAIVVYFNQHLAPRMDDFLAGNLKTEGGVWEWEVFQYSSFYDSFFKRLLFAPLGLIKYAVPVLAGVASVSAYFLNLDSMRFSMSWVDWLLVATDALVVILLGIAIIILKLPRLRVPKQRREKLAQRFGAR